MSVPLPMTLKCANRSLKRNDFLSFFFLATNLMVIIQSTYRWLQSIIKNELMATKPIDSTKVSVKMLKCR